MKRNLLLALALGCGLMSWGQTMKIHCGATTVAVPAAEAENMVYGDGGTTLTVMGKTYLVNTIDSITVDRSTVLPSSVIVDYRGQQAHVQVTGDIASQLTVQTQGADVSVVAAPGLQQEVFYTLRGNSSEGSFFMDGEFKSTITMDNLKLVNSDGAAVEIANGKRIEIILPQNTTTTLTDGPGMQKACLFVNGHTEFSGGGTLQLCGNAKHAFASDEYTRIKKSFGQLQVTKAVGDGMHIEQFFKMEGGEISIGATQGDCIDVSFTKNPADSLNGQAFVEAGTIRMQVEAPDIKGLKVDSIGNLTVSGGTIEAVVSGDGSKGISVGGNIFVQQKTSVPTLIRMAVTGTTYMPGDPVMEAKCRGIRGKQNLTLDGGTLDIVVTGRKAKAVKLDGNFIYKSGQYNCKIDAAGM